MSDELREVLSAIANRLREARPHFPNGNTRDALGVVEKAIRDALPTIERETPWDRQMREQPDE
jgi:hypothetical protein